MLALVTPRSRSSCSSMLVSLPFRLNGLRFRSYPPTLALPRLLPSYPMLPPLGIRRIFTSGTSSLPSAPFFRIGTSRRRPVVEVDAEDVEMAVSAACGSERVESALLESAGRREPAAEKDERDSERRENTIGYLLYSSSASERERCAGMLASDAVLAFLGFVFVVNSGGTAAPGETADRCELATKDRWAFIDESRASPVLGFAIPPSFGGVEKLYTLALSG